MEKWDSLEKLFPSYLQGDAEATRQLFSAILRAIQGYFHVRLSSSQDAEDLSQATLLKIHFARDRFDPQQRLKTWVFTIASRTLIDHWRGHASDQELFELAGSEGDDESGAGLEQFASEWLDPARKTELHRDINQALAKLKPMERSIVYLYGVEGLSMAEIGLALSITEGAAKLRAHRAYQELRKFLAFLAVLLPWMEKKWM